jgi:hypothetical protein
MALRAEYGEMIIHLVQARLAGSLSMYQRRKKPISQELKPGPNLRDNDKATADSLRE